jgi:aminopeptidase N
MSMRIRDLLAAWLACLPVFAAADLHHALVVSVDVQQHSIEVRDTISVHGEPPPRLEFVLHPGLVPELVAGDARLVMLDRVDEPGSEAAHAQGLEANRFRIELAEGSESFTLQYRGAIRHALRQQGEEYARGFRETVGTIGSEGVFLSSSSLWYPQLGDELITFDLDLRLPPGWAGMTQGERVAVAQEDAGQRERWHCDTPQQEIYLIAGRFNEYRRSGAAFDALALLREPDAALAQRYLDATETWVDFYSRLIGPYPYRKFALVENFWETGYGMPSFTLLGPRVIRFPFILQSSYPHEILHNWWGNGVYVDYQAGNWSEGLTSYLADHLIKEQHGEAVEYRRGLLQKYTDHVRSERDFPLSAFRSRHSASSEAVGYGKTTLLFHMLRLQMGDPHFVQGLRELYRQYRFRVTDYNDVQAVFSRVAGQELGPFFAQWVDRAGAPELRVSEPRVETREGGYRLSATLEQTQSGPPYRLRVPVAVQLQGEELAWQNVVHVEQRRRRLEFELPARPLRLVVDPEFDVFRRLDRAEIPPAISQAMGAEQVLIVLPSGATSARQQAYQALASAWQADSTRQISILRDDEIDSLPEDRSVWLFGWSNRFRPELAAALHAYSFVDDGDQLTVQGTLLDRGDRAVVLMARRSASPDQALGWLAADDVAALPGLGRKLPHYGRYSYLAFSGTAPDNTLKGQWPVLDSPMSVPVPGAESVDSGAAPMQLAPREALAPAPQRFSRRRMQRDVAFLAAEAMGGRGLGSAEIDRAADFIAEQFKEAGLQPGGDRPGSWFQVWRQRVDELDEQVDLRNVIGVLPGTDAALSDHPLVIGAHYDHFGRGAYADHAEYLGQLHPGADDNASGVAVLLEMARVLAATPRPRSILFAAFTGEETGRLGSRHFVEQAAAGSQAFAMINLDTVGRMGENPLTVFASGSAEEWQHILRGAGYMSGVTVRTVADDFGSSDQTSFIEAGVPAVQLFGGAHADMHRPSDTPDKIDADGLVKVANVLYEALTYLAGRTEPLSTTLSGGAVAGQSAAKRRVSFGTLPDFAFEGQGVRLDGVGSGSPAARAGLQAGDVIVAVNGAPVTSLSNYAAALRALAPGDRIAVRYLRAGSEHTVTTRVEQR